MAAPDALTAFARTSIGVDLEALVEARQAVRRAALARDIPLIAARLEHLLDTQVAFEKRVRALLASLPTKES